MGKKIVRCNQSHKNRDEKAPTVKQAKHVGEPICPDASVRHLFQPGELEGGGRRRATDPIWSVGIHKISHHVVL